MNMTNQILIADAQLEDIDVLLAGLMPNTKVWLVQRNENAMSYIFKALAEPNLSKLHLLAHGVSGGISFGEKTLTATDFRRQFDGAAQRDLDIAFWSCETGKGAEGLAFVQAVAEATGAKVSATSCLIGAADKNGSWELDVSVQPPFSEKARGEFGHVLALGTLTGFAGGNILASTILNLRATMDITVEKNATITGTVADIKSVYDNTFIPTNVYTLNAAANITITDAVSLTDISIIDGYITPNAGGGILTYTKIQGTISELTNDTTYISGSFLSNPSAVLYTSDASPSVANIGTLKTAKSSFAGTITAQNLSDTAANLFPSGTIATFIGSGTSVIVDSSSATAATLAQLAAIDNANGTGTITYTKISDSIGNYLNNNGTFTANASKYITDGTNGTNAIAINVTDVTGAVTIAQLTTLDSKNGGAATTYAQITDAKAALAADSTYIKDAIPVTVSDVGGASLAELNALRGKTTGLITAKASDNSAATLSGLAGTNNAYTITVTGSSVASNLKLIDAATTLAVGASGVGTITGNETDIKDVVQAVGITKAANYAVTVDSGTLSVANANIIDAANGNGVITATITAATRVSDLKTLTATNTTNAYNITFDAADASSAALDILAIDTATTVAVGATAVTTVTGSAANIKAVVDAKIANTITMTTSWNSIVTGTTAAASDLNSIAATITTGTITATAVSGNITGSASAIAAAAAIADFSTVSVSVNLIPTVTQQDVTDLNAIDTETSGIITATIGGSLGTLLDLSNAGVNSLTNNNNNNAYTITLSDTGSVAAANLRDINLKTTPTVNANLVDTITGEASVIIDALGAGISYKSNVAINVTSFDGTTYPTVTSQIAALGAIQAASAGSAITATLSGTVAELVALPGTNNPYTVTIITDTSADAADLNTINTKVSTVVGAANITGLTGTAVAIKTLLEQTLVTPTPTITLGTIASVAVSDVGVGVATLASDLNYIDAHTGAVVVNASGVIAISGSAADVYTTLVTNTSTTTVNNPTVTISDATTANAGVDYLAQLVAINAKTSGAITLINAAASTALSGTGEDVAAALLGVVGSTAAVAVTGTSATAGANYLAQLLAINTVAGGVITVSGTAASTALSGTGEDVAAALLGVVGSTAAVAVTGMSATAGANYLAQLLAINTAAGGVITLTNAAASTALLGSAADLTAALSGVSTYTGNITISDEVGVEITATNLSTIGGATSGTVTVTNAIAITGSLSQVTAALITSATAVTAATATVIINDAAYNAATNNVSILATDLSAIGNATTGTVTVTNAIKITGTISEVTAALVTPASSVVAATAVVDISGSATILQLNNVDAMTSGVITATVADTAANLAKLTGTGNKYTLTVSDATPTYATDLLTIDAATTQIITATAVGTITGTAANIAKVIASSGTGITLSGTVNASITDTNVSATDLKAIDLVVGGTVTASSVTALTGSAADIGAVLIASTGTPTITLNNKANIAVVIDGSSSSTIDAALLKTINQAGFASVDARAISHIHGSAADVDALYTFAPATGAAIQLANNVKVLIDGTTATAALLNHIDLNTTATIDAELTVTSITGTAAELAMALSNQAAIDTKANVAVTVASGIVTAADLLAIDANTTATVNATAVTEVTGSIADVKTALVSNYGTSGDKLQTSGSEVVTISDGVSTKISAIDLASIGGATSGAVTVTNAIAISGNKAEVTAALLTPETKVTATSANITITDSASIAELGAIDNVAGNVTANTIIDSVDHLFTSGNVHSYVKAGVNVVVTGAFTETRLAQLDLANGAGNVTSSYNTTLASPNMFGIQTATTPSWTVSNGVVAKVIDAAGDQVIHIAAGGKLSLTGSDGHNVVVFDAFQLGDLTVSSSGSTVIFSDKATPTPHQIASIAVTANAPSQTIGFSDGTHVELTLTGTALALVNSSNVSTPIL